MKQTNNWEETKSRILDKISYLCKDNYACNRVWSAWGYGTMHESDFEPLEETEFVNDMMELFEEELTNLLKTVAEANGEEKEIPELMKDTWTKKDKTKIATELGWNAHRSHFTSNISEKYPEFKELVKEKN